MKLRPENDTINFRADIRPSKKERRALEKSELHKNGIHFSNMVERAMKKRGFEAKDDTCGFDYPNFSYEITLSKDEACRIPAAKAALLESAKEAFTDFIA